MSQSPDPKTGQTEATEPKPIKEVAVRVSDGDPDEDISHPYLELYRHTLLRGANMGSLLALVIGPPVLLFRGVRQPMEFLRRLGNICANGVGIGVGVAALMTAVMTWGNKEEQIYDRCYRLRLNEGQVRTDKFTYGGAVAGGLAGIALASNARLTGGIHGASMGIGLAVFAHVATKSSKEKKT